MKKAFFGKIETQIIRELKTTENTVKIALAWFTNESIFLTLLELLKNNKQVELILNNDHINNRINGLNFNSFIQEGGKLYFSDTSYLMHHKFVIIDNKTLISGSYNWTYNAEFRNAENIIILESKELINQFSSEFVTQKNDGYLQSDNIVPKPLNIISNDVKEYLKEDYLSKSSLELFKGDLNKSKIAIKEALEIDSEDEGFNNRILEIENKIDNPEYQYHIEDGQFSFDHFTDRLLGQEGDIVECVTDRTGDLDKFYILYIAGFYVECIGNIEREFPKNKEEHDFLHKDMEGAFD